MESTVKNSRARRFGVRAVVVAGTAGAVLAMAAPMASAQDAPMQIPGATICDEYRSSTGDPAQACLAVDVQSGTFDNNGFNLPIKAGDMVIASVLTEDGDGNPVLLPRDDGHNGVYAKPMTVPGGVLGIDLPFNNLFGLAAVTAEVQAVEAPSFNGIVTEFDISLPVRMKINNAFLGDNCYLGSETAPVEFRLLKTNTDEDAPTYEPTSDGMGVKVGGVKSAATGFAIPAASGCGPFGVLNPIVNWRAKVPATSGTSLTTVSNGYLYFPGQEGNDPLDGLDGGGTGSLGSLGSLSSSGSSGS
ncbi:hypothetical protein [Rhodococcus sp. ARC_M6]|uniref:hypothetical protein n=1 Tax=Rhodococcus sp. ARC_M6 TaxID=2928852 RepID=UPI001FB25935|nr:hypothetical protein [Rhodococcus sp. ARC_M6]MCJ0905490.1 hypothetical protein [Rhodococcus sp. ARC_M6]